MFYWLYDIPVLAVVALFAVVFVGLCWLGTILVSPKLVPWFQGKGPERNPRRLSSIFWCDLRSAARLTRCGHLPKPH